HRRIGRCQEIEHRIVGAHPRLRFMSLLAPRVRRLLSSRWIHEPPSIPADVGGVPALPSTRWNTCSLQASRGPRRLRGANAGRSPTLGAWRDRSRDALSAEQGSRSHLWAWPARSESPPTRWSVLFTSSA